MIDYEYPKNWTKQYVDAHRSECLLYLREINLGVVRYIKSGCYAAATVGIAGIMDGLDMLLKSGKTSDVRFCIAAYSCAAAELSALADPDMFEKEIRDKGIQSQHQGKDVSRSLRDTAISGFMDAQDYATSGEMRRYAASMVRALKEGVPAERIRRDYAPNFPRDIQDILLDLDDEFYVPEIMECAPERCVVLDKTRLLFTHRTVGTNTPVSWDPVEMPSDTEAPPRAGGGGEFDAWVEGNGWDEDDLEEAYKRVRLRRNIYGILSIIPVFGIILLPFWLRAVFITKAIRNRRMDVGFNIFIWIVAFIYGIPTLYIYPIIMGQIIRWTNWGMGLRDRRALIPTFALLALAAFLLIRSNDITFPDISRLKNYFSTTSKSDTEQAGSPVEKTPDTDMEQTETPDEETPDDVDDAQLNQKSGFIFPDSDTELILQQEAENLSDSDLNYAINELYARYGYIFRSNEFRGYYDQFDWYTGKITADEFSVDNFNQIEQRNWNLLVNERDRRKMSN